MLFRKVQALRGPNIWANFPVIEAWIDLGELKDSSSDAIPGFIDRLMNWLPGLIEHRCSVGTRGGFLERLRRGTYLAHILEHVALELQSAAGTPVSYGKTRQANDDGVYKVGLEYEHEELGRAALETGRRLCLAAVHDSPVDSSRELELLTAIARRHTLPAGQAAIVNAAKRHDIPVQLLDHKGLLQLGHGNRQCRLLDSQVDSIGAVAEAVARDNERTWNLLYNAGIPVAEGRTAESADDAVRAAAEIGAPVLIKPRAGQHRRGTGIPLIDPAEIAVAYELAACDSAPVLVERHVAGTGYRLLVVGEHVVAACIPGDHETDILADIHPEIASRAVDAAQSLGLDFAGVDIVATDIRKSLEAQGGIVTAISPRPDIGQYARFSDETAVRVGREVIEHLFPDGSNGRIPVVAVTGTNGKTTTTRFVAHVLSQIHAKVGMTCTEGIFVDGRRLATGDCSGPQSAKAVLQHPKVDAAVLETARGGILRAGLGFDRCDVAVVTNIGEGDHLGSSEVDTPEQLAYVKSVIVAAVSQQGFAVLNAEDPLVVWMAQYCKGAVIYFARHADHPVVVEHRAKGGRAVFARDRSIIIAHGAKEEVVIKLVKVPLTHAGLISFHVENALATTAACWALGVPLDVVRTGLETFAADLDKDPGRFNLMKINGATVILDYGHNADALRALIDSLDNFPHRKRWIVYSSAGDRRDVDLIRQGEIIGNGFDRVILYEDPRYLRGRSEGGITGLLRSGLSRGKRMREIDEVRSWEKSADLALKSVGEGDLLVLQPDMIDEAVEFVGRYFKDGKGHEISVNEALIETTPQPDEIVYPVEDFGVEVRPHPLGRGAHATRVFGKNEMILRGWGERTTIRTWATIQIDHGEHIIPPSPLVCLNHSCYPNCGLLVRRGVEHVSVHALRPIEVGEELTLDYGSFEVQVKHIDGPCQCGAEECRGRVTGYESMPQKHRELLGVYIAEYLREPKPVTTRRKESENLLVAAHGS